MKKKPFFYFIISFTKENILSFLFVFFIIGLLLFSSSNISAAKDGLTLWTNSVVPSLLPFFIATELLSYTSVVDFLSILFHPIMRPLFHVPGRGAFPFLMGIISRLSGWC